MDLDQSGQAAELRRPSEGPGRPSDPASPGPARPARDPAPHLLLPDGKEIPAALLHAAEEKPAHGKDGRRSLLRRHPFAAPIAAIILALVGGGGYLYWDNAQHFEATDDAYVAARQFAIAPQVSGYLTAVPVTDNQHVAAGQVIARIDDRVYQAALQQAEAQVAAAQASIENVNAQIAVQQAQVAQNEAQIEQTRANLTFAQQQATRYQTLAHDGAGSVQSAQQYTSQLHQEQAALRTAQAALAATARQVAVLKAQHSSAEATLKQALAQRDQAKLNLSYTTITAAQPGRVVQISAGVGEYAQPGTSISMFVPDEIWVSANFKETQLNHMHPGEPATIHIDAYPDRTIRGHVASVQPGSGTAFSLLPAENATGNWVKIVQRVPVKIVMEEAPRDVALGPGMSVEATVRVNPWPSLYERLKNWL